MNLGRYVACICEGADERAILDLLLDEDKLIFNRDNLIDNEIIKDRKAESFERKYLGKGFEEKITVLRILDSRREEFKLGDAYEVQVKVINVITAPEIEMLIIINENKRDDFNKSKEKPSKYCKTKLKYKNVKSYDFVKDYFGDIDKLLKAIKMYKSKSRVKKGEYTLCDLLK